MIAESADSAQARRHRDSERIGGHSERIGGHRSLVVASEPEHRDPMPAGEEWRTQDSESEVRVPAAGLTTGRPRLIV